MRLGVDLAILGGVRTGVARYMWNMLNAMVSIYDELRIFFYGDDIEDTPIPPDKWTLRKRGWWRLRPFPLWFSFELPTLLAKDKITLFWGICNLLPLNLPKVCPGVVTIHDLTPLLYPQTMDFRTWITHRILLKKSTEIAEQIITVSQATAEGVRKLLHVPRSKISVIYEGVDPIFKPMSQRDAQEMVKERFGISPPFLLNVSTLEPRKGQEILLKAISSLNHPPLLVIAGGRGWRYGKILSLIRVYESQGKVKYLGRVSDEDLLLLYNAATLMVYPSFYEGFGLPVLEAMACGCPVLCSNSSSLPEVGGESVEYFPPGDWRSLAEKLKALIEDEAQRQKMAEKGINQASRFSYKKAAEQFLSLIKEITG